MTNPTPDDRTDNNGRGPVLAGGMLVTIRVHDCEQPLDIYIDAVIVVDDEPHLRCRHTDQGCQPIGDPWDFAASDIADIHIW